ncbi:MAG: hypothetical protein KDA92_26980, partial [Planctomycetales bacterium]|nr:hypothetical protein [Planctomycetales bacterium]
DVLGETIEIHSSEQGPARGAAILGALAAQEASGYGSTQELLRGIANRSSETNTLVSPSLHAAEYVTLYQAYRQRAEEVGAPKA